MTALVLCLPSVGKAGGDDNEVLGVAIFDPPPPSPPAVITRDDVLRTSRIPSATAG